MRKPIQLVRSGNGNTKHLFTVVVKDFCQAVFLVFGPMSKQLGGKVFCDPSHFQSEGNAHGIR